MLRLWVPPPPPLAQQEGRGSVPLLLSRLPPSSEVEQGHFHHLPLSDLGLLPLLQMLRFLSKMSWSQDWKRWPSCLSVQGSQEFPRTMVQICCPAPCHKARVALFLYTMAEPHIQRNSTLISRYLLVCMGEYRDD